MPKLEDDAETSAWEAAKGTPIDREKLLSLGYLGGGRTCDRVNETRDANGKLMKRTTDPLGNTVTQHSHDRQDVQINLPAVRAYMGVEEVR